LSNGPIVWLIGNFGNFIIQILWGGIGLRCDKANENRAVTGFTGDGRGRVLDTVVRFRGRIGNFGENYIGGNHTTPRAVMKENVTYRRILAHLSLLNQYSDLIKRNR